MTEAYSPSFSGPTILQLATVEWIGWIWHRVTATETFGPMNDKLGREWQIQISNKGRAIANLMRENGWTLLRHPAID